MPSEIQPVLSICIPTYHRAALLGDALRAVAVQWAEDLTDEQRERIEIVISDNHSPDETAASVSTIKEQYPSLRLSYFCQPENKGPDANILSAARMASGDYLYLLSDDDILLPGALAEMLALIQTHPELDAFCLNTRPFLQYPSEETPTDFAVTEDHTIAGRDACLQFLGTRITFLSLCLMRRERLLLETYDAFIGSRFMHSYLYLDILAGGRGMLVTRRAFLAVRRENTGGYNFFEVFVSHFADLMRYARRQGYAETAVKSVLSRHLTRYIAPFVAMFKLRGAYGTLQPDYRDGARRLLAEYGPRPFLVFGLLPLMFAPRLLTRGLQSVARALRSVGAVR